jgi:hypothetical protein
MLTTCQMRGIPNPKQWKLLNAWRSGMRDHVFDETALVERTLYTFRAVDADRLTISN